MFHRTVSPIGLYRSQDSRVGVDLAQVPKRKDFYRRTEMSIRNPTVVVAVLVSLLAGTLLLAGYVNRPGEAGNTACGRLASGPCGMDNAPSTGCCGTSRGEKSACAKATSQCSEGQSSCGSSAVCEPNSCIGCCDPNSASGCCCTEPCGAHR
jgi:hypothetical protein